VGYCRVALIYKDHSVLLEDGMIKKRRVYALYSGD
jgi:hypothetical protein